MKKPQTLPSKIQPTGIGELDLVLNGGIPEHSIVLLTGRSGTGKSILSLQWLFEGCRKYQEPGLYLSLTETTTKLLRNIQSFGFYDDDALKPNGVNIIDLRSLIEDLRLLDKSNLESTDVGDLVHFIVETARNMNAKRIVLDSLTSLLYRYKDQDIVRQLVYDLSRQLESIGATAWLVTEVTGDNYSHFGVEEFISDGIIQLTGKLGEQSVVRRLQVIKMRGHDFRSGPMVFDINRNGITLYPKIPIYDFVAKTEFENRIPSGVPRLDEMMGGGFPQGHMILIGGNTGTGKSTMAQQFLHAGLEHGENAVFIAFEESKEQVKKTALEHDWDLEHYEQAGQLEFVSTNLIDINPDRILKQTIDKVERLNANRVVLDSVSSFETATMTPALVREFLLQLSLFLKSRGTCCVMTYLTADMFEAGSGQLLGGTTSNDYRLSSIVDSIIIMRYVERDQEVKKLMNVLKLRGSKHDKSIREFEINRSGVHIGEKFHT